ncbi:MAG: hypothetical protein HYT41_00850 [Candidatus Sungbacteria bacterium]|nr:hypothetical protein [Candidatus Sungbacteria bacterium]
MHSKKTQEAAKTLHERFGAHLPWRTKFLLAIAVDFVDVVLVGLFFWAPGIHVIVNAVQFFIGLSLFGLTGGIVQILELVVGLSSIMGTVIGILPMLTIACAITYGMERHEVGTETEIDQSAMMPTTEVPSMEILVGLVTLIAGTLLWWNSVIGFWSIFWLAGGAALATFALRLARWGAIPHTAIRVMRVVTGLALVVDLAGLGIFAFFLTPESYRIRAWEELQKNTFFSLQVKAAKAADAAGKSIDLQLHKLGHGGSLTGYARNKLADIMTSKGAEPEEKEPPEVLIGEDEEPSGVKKIFSWVGENIVRPDADGEIGKKKQAAKKDLTAIEKKAAELGLGPMRTKLFASDAVLGKAAEMRDEDSAWFWTLLPWLGGLFGFVIIFGCIQTRERNYVRPEPQVPLDRFI